MAYLNDKFVTLAEGIKEPSCNVYAVVNCVVQVSSLVKFEVWLKVNSSYYLRSLGAKANPQENSSWDLHID